MAISKRALGPLERLFPMPTTLIASGSLENPGVLTAVWLNVVASTPPTLALGLRETRNTLAQIRTTGCFTVNQPSTALVDKVDFLGMATGNTGLNKLQAAGLTTMPGERTGAPLIAECPYNLECVVIDTQVVGAYHVILAEIVNGYADETILAASDDTLIDLDALDPLLYLPGNREYRALGPKVADAYSVGKSLIQRHK